MKRLGIMLAIVLVSGGALASNQVSLLQKAKNSKLVRKAVAVVASVGIVCGAMSCGDSDDDVATQGMVEETAVVMESAKIGMQYTAELFQTSRMGAELAAKQINAQGGINGMPLELLIRDNGRTPEQGIVVAEEFILDDKVHALVGPEFSTIAVQVGPVAQRYGIPMMTTAATNPAVTGAGNYVFMAAFTDSFQGKVMARLAFEEFGARTAAVLNVADDVYSAGLADTFTHAFTHHGGEVILRDSYPVDALEFDDQLVKVAEARPDVVFVPGFTPDSPLIVKQGTEMGIDTIWMGGDGWDLPNLLETGGDALNGTYFSSYFSNVAPAEELPIESQIFTTAYMSEYGELPNGLSALAYDAVYLVAQAMQRATNLDGAAIRAEIEETYNYSGATQLAGYDINHHAEKSAVINTISDGKIVFFRLIQPVIDHSIHIHVPHE